MTSSTAADAASATGWRSSTPAQSARLDMSMDQASSTPSDGPMPSAGVSAAMGWGRVGVSRGEGGGQRRAWVSRAEEE
eukprot:364615-Chlamydomonas_euryale.AAC.1